MKNPENPSEYQEDSDLLRIREIDEEFIKNDLVTIDEEGQEFPWAHSEEAKQLLAERKEILKRHTNDPDFKLLYAAYEAPKEGKKTAEEEKFRISEIKRVKQRISDLKDMLKKEEAYLTKLEK